jgi:predicted glycogen debranching enzyme
MAATGARGPGDVIALDRALAEDLGQASRREWLVTNGLGGYASGTMAMPTRRYHALLVAAVAPPATRSVTLARLEEALQFAGRSVRLDCSEYQDGTITPAGYQFQQQFRLDHGLPVWRYALDGVVLERRMWMPYGQNQTCIAYRLLAAPGPLELDLTPLVAWRDHHALQQKLPTPFAVDALANGCRLALSASAWLALTCNGARFEHDADWHYRFFLREEAARGFDAVEDLYRPGHLRVTLRLGEEAVFEARFGQGSEGATGDDATLVGEQGRRRALLQQAKVEPETRLAQLVLAADQFLVRRGDQQATIIAGYPWFADWGRDCMIALPGLTLTTGRRAEARAILLEWAKWLKDGLLPNRFPDQGEAPEYNSADASLWFIHAAERYIAAASDLATQRRLYPHIVEIVDQYLQGTRFGIGVDPDDQLLRAGAPGCQLTWMDAKVGDWVVTPRRGKPVELSALWYNALRTLERWSMKVGDRSPRYGGLAEACADSFNRRFWYADGGYLFDVIDGDDGDDPSLRPDQIFAMSLPFPVLAAEHRLAVLRSVERELLTPMGLRTLSPHNAAYRGAYSGDATMRDGAYHQGTVWPWLLGPYLTAHLKLHADRAYAKEILDTFFAHLPEAGVGSISEIFDGDAPHAARGCYAQAWSVGELLRLLRSVDGGRGV